MPKPTIQDESLVPAYELPELLQFQNGERVQNAAMWPARRAELLALFEEHVYGATPEKILETRAERVESGDFGPNATRQQIALFFGAGGREVRVDLLIYLPRHSAPCPIFLGLNFDGNHTICHDPKIRLPQSWVRDNEALGATRNRAGELGRARMAASWLVETILARGYGVATAYYGDLDPDFDDGFDNGVHPLFYSQNQTRPAPNEWGAIGAWAWGLSRILDYLEKNEAVDARRVALWGHSRLGKAALWAGAGDERFALVISNNSGCGGAALSRRCFGETVEAINTRLPHWFCANFHAFNARENELPLDQHGLLSLVAPRPLYVASAEDDFWADPRGEWLSLHGAAPVWELLGVEGHSASEMPPVETPIVTRLGYHLRRGKHGVNDYDWARFLDFADRYLG